MSKNLIIPALLLFITGILAINTVPSTYHKVNRPGILRSESHQSDEDRLWKHLYKDRGYDVAVPPSTFDKDTNTTRLVVDM